MDTTDDFQGAILGIGNPLLDICVVDGEALLSKYSLKANDAILADETHLPLYHELTKNPNSFYIAGGATQNSMRGAQRLLPPKTCTFIGCISNDKFGDELRKAAEKDGLTTQYYIDPTTPTGTCATIICGQDRSLVANLSAANNFKVSHLEKREVWATVERARLFYIAGFFLTVSMESILKVAEHALKIDKIFAMNLSAPFLPQFYKDNMDAASPYWDIIFGNESEALAYSESHNFGSKEIEEIALKIAALPKLNNRPRLVVITQGQEPTIVVENGELRKFRVFSIDPEEIKDTNGAGDAFVGGFLSEYVKGSPVSRCVEVGHWLAGLVIRQAGPVYPEGELKYPSH